MEDILKWQDLETMRRAAHRWNSLKLLSSKPENLKTESLLSNLLPSSKILVFVGKVSIHLDCFNWSFPKNQGPLIPSVQALLI